MLGTQESRSDYRKAEVLTVEGQIVYSVKNEGVIVLFNDFFKDHFKNQVLILILLSI